MYANKIMTAAISAVIAMSMTSGSAIALPDQTSVKDETPKMDMQPMEIKGMEKCYGISKTHMNDCSTASHGCAGQSQMDKDKKEWIIVPTGVCNKIVGGSTTSS